MSWRCGSWVFRGVKEGHCHSLSKKFSQLGACAELFPWWSMYHAADYSTVQAQYCQNGFTCFAEPTFRAAGGCCRLGDGANCQLPTSCVPQASLSQSCNAACSANARITKWSVPSAKYSFSNSGELIPSKHRFCLALLLHQLLANGRADTS